LYAKYYLHELVRMRQADRHQAVREAVNAVRLLQGVSRRQNSEFMRKYRITGPQLGALRFVSLTPGISMRELSEKLYLHVSTMTGIVDRLVKKGYVQRERSKEDRRVVRLSITATGRRVIKKTPLAGMGLLIHTIGDLPDRQLREVHKVMSLLLDLMKEAGDHCHDK
jgi:DNA-binding MarR family transcriptional regulator